MDMEMRKRRKAYAVAEEIGLSRADRIALADYLLRRDITSWQQLDEQQLDRILDAMEGYQLISHLLHHAPKNATIASWQNDRAGSCDSGNPDALA